MKKLISLELNKINLKPHIFGVIIANFIILSLSILCSIILSSTLLIESIPGLQIMAINTITISTLLIKSTLIVWEAVLISLIIINEFQNKTIDILFTYPLDRMKLFLSKMILIFILMFGLYTFSFIFQNLFIFFLSKNFSFVTYNFENIFIQFISIISAISIGLLPLSFGLAKQSTIITILSSLIIVSIISNTQIATTGLISIPIFSIILGMLGILISVYSVKKILSSDITH